MAALEGLRVIDMATVFAGPGAARHLADFGADQPALYTLSETGEQGYGILEYQFGPNHKKYPANDFQ